MIKILKLIFFCFSLVIPSLLSGASFINISNKTEEINVVKDQAILLKTIEKIKEISIANPRISDALDLEHNAIYLLGKEYGVTTLTIDYASSRDPINIKINVIPDIEATQKILDQKFPSLSLSVSASGGKLTISGLTKRTHEYEQILDIMYTMSPDGVINLLDMGETKTWNINIFTLALEQEQRKKFEELIAAYPNSSNGLEKENPSREIFIKSFGGFREGFLLDNEDRLRDSFGLTLINQEQFELKSDIYSKKFFIGETISTPVLSNNIISVKDSKIGMDFSLKIPETDGNYLEMTFDFAHHDVGIASNHNMNSTLFEHQIYLQTQKIEISQSEAVIVYPTGVFSDKNMKLAWENKLNPFFSNHQYQEHEETRLPILIIFIK